MERFRKEETSEAILMAKKLQEALHAHPEGSFSETEATKQIKELIGAVGLVPLDLGMETGAAAFLDGGRDKTVMLRADIDAVMTEQGPRHVCGHDYHAAALAGAMKLLTGKKEQLPCNVLFVFQPAEETTEGAKYMLDHGLLDTVRVKPYRLFGIHNRPELPCGMIAVHAGALMAEKSEFCIRFTGKTGHAGEPEHCIDPLLAGAQFTCAVQSVISRDISPMASSVCGVFGFRSGDEENNPPEDAVLTGTLRSLAHPVHEDLMKRIEELAEHTAAAFRCGVSLDWTLHVPLLFNGPEMYTAAKAAAEAIVGAERICETEPSLGSDDFAVFGGEIPAFYFWVGSGEEGKQNGCWHESSFRVADGYLDTAIPLLAEVCFCS